MRRATNNGTLQASGNAREHVFSPAVEADVLSVSFYRVHREIVDELTENAVTRLPTFSQSEFADFPVIQPSNVLGSSFATPLISGLAALMRSREDLPAYRDMRRRAGFAARLQAQLDHSIHGEWSERRDGVIDKLFVNAIQSQPHPHLSPDHYEVCPECAFFANDAYINFGLFKLDWVDLDGAEQLLRAAEAFAPSNPHAAANLGMVYARKAANARQDNRWSDVSELLREAARLQGKASALRPDFEPYRRRSAEFAEGANDP